MHFPFQLYTKKKNTKPHYHSQHNSSHKSKKHKKAKSKTKSKFKKMEVSREDRIICKSDKHNLDKYNNFTIEEFLIKHRFKLSTIFSNIKLYWNFLAPMKKYIIKI